MSVENKENIISLSGLALSTMLTSPYLLALLSANRPLFFGDIIVTLIFTCGLIISLAHSDIVLKINAYGAKSNLMQRLKAELRDIKNREACKDAEKKLAEAKANSGLTKRNTDKKTG